VLIHPDLGLPREVDKEKPVEGHKTDCKVFYIFNYPMTCGEELVNILCSLPNMFVCMYVNGLPIVYMCVRRFNTNNFLPRYETLYPGMKLGICV
jgi:hypothetical protein